ncbi:Thioredoxin [Thalassobacillus cyri]|uniref:Thioredoxin n=1 Tax=Thalassobacillus cyri TaxID=571932 RepID=A0A1H4H8K1_9BACI|nr:thioredoxin family protein [Thalassobacillus cyri]SEB18167.1 Thioredoxin [Thalassobacillus cyri]
MERFYELEALKVKIAESKIALLYISGANCSVCHSLLPQIEEVVKKYPELDAYQLEADDVPAVAGEYTIFTVPVVIIFVDGKEVDRKARFVPIEELDHQLSKMIGLIFD